MKKVYLFLAFIAVSISIANGQVIVASQDFEVVPATPTLAYTATGVGFIRSGTGTGTQPANANFFATGARGWGSESGTSVITFANQTISPLLDGFVDFRIAGIGLSNGAGIDPGDIATVAISLNNGSTYSDELTLAGSANKQFWDFSAPGYAIINYDGNNVPTAFTSSIANGISRIVVKLPNTTSQVILRITFQSGTNELWLIDDVRVGYGTKYWDGNGATPGLGFSNTWGNTFTTDAAGSIPTVNSYFVDDIRYQGTAGTVTLAASQNVFSHLINIPGYQFATTGIGPDTLAGAFKLSTNNIAFAPIAGADLRLPGIISGSGAAGSVILSKTGAGALILANTNTFTGKISITQGIVEGTSINSFGANPASNTSDHILLNGGGIRNTTGTTWAVSGNRGITLGASGGTIDVNTGGDITLSTIITGAGNLTKTGPGNLFLNANNSYAGNTIIGDGTAILSAANRIPNTSNIVLSGGALSTGATTGFDETVGTLSVTAGSSINLGSNNHSLLFSSAPAAFTGRLTISGWTGAINATGSAGKIFVGSNVNLTQLQRDSIQFSGYLVGAVTQLNTGEIVPSGTLSPDYFRSNVVSGGWTAISSWQSSMDSIFWIPATLTPTTQSNSIEIRPGHTITVVSAIPFDELRINGTLEVQTSGRLTVANGVGDDIIVGSTGVLKLTSTTTYATTLAPATNVTINVAPGGKITIGAGGAVGTGFETPATSTIVTWQNGSVFEWNSSISPVLNTTYFPNAGAGVPVFLITKLSSPVSGNSPIINGLTIVNFPFTLAGNSPKTFRNGISGNSTLTQTTNGSSFNITGPNAILGGANLGIILISPLNLASSVTIPADSSVVVSGGSINNNILLNVLTVNGTLDVTTIDVTNLNSTVTINGKYKTANTGGFTGGGSSIPSGVVNVNTGSTIEYYANGNQPVQGSTVAYSNLTLSGSGTKSLASGTNPNGTVYITGSAIFDIGSFTVGNASTNLTMDGGRFRISGSTPSATKPDIDGTYLLTGGVIEFNGSNASRQTVKPKNALSVDIIYNEVEITGTNVGQSIADIVLNATSGKFTVVGPLTSAANFYMSSKSIKSSATPPNNSLVAVQDGANFFTSSSKGFSGFATSFTDNSSISSTIPAANISLAAGSTVYYDRAGDQNISNDAAYHHLVLSGTSGTKTAPSGTLIVKGNLSKTGANSFVPNDGLVLLNGTTQTFAALPFSQLELSNGTKTTAGSGRTTIDSLLKINSTAVLNINNDSVNLLSTLSRSARVDKILHAVPASAITYNSTGKFIVHRFIRSGAKWRYLSVPTDNNTQSFKSAWRENASSGVDNPLANHGFLMGDPRANWQALGFDLRTGQNPSIKTYDAATDTWKGIPSALGSMQSKAGYMAFIQGDRATNFPNTSSTTLRTHGKLYVGNQGSIVIPANTTVSVGNPYASPVNMIGLLSPASSNGLVKAYQVWDPQGTGSIYGLGRYQVMIWDGFDYTVFPGGGSYGNFGSVHNSIESGQAFFIRGDVSGGSIEFKEQYKELNATASYFTPGAQQHINALLKNGSMPGDILDGILVNFGSDTDEPINGYDVLKMQNSNENVSINHKGTLLIIEQQAPIRSNDTIYINLTNLRAANYQWEINSTTMDYPSRKGFLVDSYLKTSTPLNLSGITSINFNVVNIAGSYAADRFKIVFNQPDLGPLPVTITTVTATRKADKTIDVAWKVEDEINISSYEVQRSANGSNFSSIHTRSGLANNAGTALYNQNDALPLAADNFYRIKANSLGGQVQYSAIVKVSTEKTSAAITVSPNPVTGKQMQVRFNSVAAGLYQLNLVNTAGQVIYKGSVKVAGGSFAESIQLSNDVAAGRYDLLVISPDGNKTNQQVIIQ